jgi:hypothetical protein
MAKNTQDGGELGFRKSYKMTGTPGYAGGPGETTIDKGNSGSKRANNAVLNGNKMAKDSKVGPGKNLKDIGGGNFY